MADSMKSSLSKNDKKRHGDPENLPDDEEDDDLIGPLIAQAVPLKKRKVLSFEKVYLENLPSAEGYEKSYMHRDVVTHIAFTKTNFLVTASADGHVKFWKKCEEEGIEFVKHYRSHMGPVVDLAASSNGELCCSVSSDKSIKVFDIVNFDMINMMVVPYVPLACGWIYKSGDPISAMAISDKDSSHIHIYDGRGSQEPIHTVDKLHYHPVSIIKYNPVYEVVVSCDQKGMLEYWTGPKHDYAFPKKISWQYKTDTDLYEFMTCKSVPYSLEMSPDGKLFATISDDHKVRIFKFLTGKMSKVLDESLQQYSDMQQMKQVVPNMEFGRRLAVERDTEKSHALGLSNIIFDETGHFLLYATMLGIKVINLYTNRCVRTLGLLENARFLKLSLCQGMTKKISVDMKMTTADKPLLQGMTKTIPVDMEMTAADNPLLQTKFTDPTLFCTALKKNRFYMFTRREPIDTESASGDRDVFNEKPSKEDMVSAIGETGPARLCENCILHTTMGDIHCTLFHKECPKTVENFCVHSRNAYYNGLIFHRVIKSFMLQTGDPLGNGTGGESIWGGEFEDEFHPSLRHDRPYTLSMANAGPNTNGSQFFITVVPTPWLDNKHTVFGRVTRGMEVIQNISNVKTNPKTDKPYDDIQIVNVTLK